MRVNGNWIIFLLSAPLLTAQWAVYHDPATPRAKDGKPNLIAPAPHVNNRPDLTGIWRAQSAPVSEIAQFLLPGGINGLGEDLPNKYFLNFFFDVAPEQIPFQPAARAMYEKMSQSPPPPMNLCHLASLPLSDLTPEPLKIIQSSRQVTFLYEADQVFRQIFTDGRKLPADPQPTWLGYSVGKWAGDDFVIDTVGNNAFAPIDVVGHPRSESMHLTETLHRRDFGHMDVQITLDDPKIYTKPVTVKTTYVIMPDTEVIESFCAEDEKDTPHMRPN